MNLFEKNIFFPAKDELSSRLHRNVMSNLDVYVLLLEEQLGILESVSGMKDEVIIGLKDQLQQRDEALNRQISLIGEVEVSNSMFLRVLSELKEANNKKEVKDILLSYEIKCEELPYFN